MVVISWSRRYLAPFAMALRIGLKLLVIPVLTLAFRVTITSCKISLTLGACSFLAATLICWSGGSSSAWAKSNPDKPTVHFRVEQLEVEAKEENEPPTVVSVRNKNDQDNALDFAAEVQVGTLTPGAGTTAPPETDTTQAQSTLSFLDDPLDLALRRAEEDAQGDGAYEECWSDPKNAGELVNHTHIATTTVFVSVDSDENLKDLGFRAKLRPQRAGLETANSYIPNYEEKIPIVVCWRDPVNEQNKTIGSDDFKPFNISFEVDDPFKGKKPPFESANLVETVWYSFQPDTIPYKWSSLSGHLAVVSDNGAAGPDTLSVRLNSPGPGQKDAFSRIWIWATGFFLSTLAGLSVLLALLQFWGVDGHWRRAVCLGIVTLAFLFVVPVLLEPWLNEVAWKWGMVASLSVIVGLTVFLFRTLRRALFVVVGLIILIGLLLLALKDKWWVWGIGYLLFIVVSLYHFLMLLRQWQEDDTPVKKWLRTKHLFDIKKGWGSNLTGVAAILGTVLAAGVLPEDAFFMSKEQYILLNLTFGIAILVVTVWQSLMCWGWTYVPACAATMGAAFGELIVVLLLAKEIALQGNMPPVGGLFLQICLVAISAVVTIYAFVHIRTNMKEGKEKEDEEMLGLP